MMKKNSFTLVELLIVIAIIAVLAGLLLPALNSVMKKAEVTKARTEIKALEIAIKQYESTYSYMPYLPTGADKPISTTIMPAPPALDTEYQIMIKYLSSLDPNTTNFTNSRNMRMLEVKTPGIFNDTWDNPFNVVLDNDYNGQIDKTFIRGIYNPTPPATYIYSSCVIWSMGPDGQMDDTAPSAAVNKDNIYSFETDWVPGQGHIPR